MADPVISPLSPPVDLQLPASATELINMVASYLKIDGLAGLQGIIISDTEPATTDRDKVWVKLDVSSGRAIGFYRYLSGWQLVPVIVGTGETEPANPKPGELFYNTKEDALKGNFSDGWTTELWPKGASTARPASVPVGYLYYDTDISRLLRSTSQGWSTVDGCIGEVRILDGVTTDQAKTLNPGWAITQEFSGKFPMGYSDDHAVGTTGGRKTFPVSASGGKNNAQSGSEISLNGLTVDGKSMGGTGAVVAYSAGAASLSQDVDITPPFKAVIFIRKNY